MIKPDRVLSNYKGTIKKMILEYNFSILHEMTVQLDEDSATLFYAEHYEQSFFNNLIKYMASGPMFVMVLEKEYAVVDWKELIGSTDAGKAKVSHPNSCPRMHIYGPSLKKLIHEIWQLHQWSVLGDFRTFHKKTERKFCCK
ncbi:hypothetical protein MKX03_000023 [Papaver bracteatum]|nr:hypothetical protein MKX03_000023 [Papaver bracteatum]